MTTPTKQVAKRDNGALAIPDDQTGLSGEFGRADIVMPVCSLAQPMSQDKGNEGRFWFPDGRSLETMETVVLNVLATRTLWGPIDSGIGAPLCRSVDRKMGITSYASFVEAPGPMEESDQTYVPCSDCRFHNTATNFEKIDGLWCPYGYTLLMVDVELGEPFIYFIKGMQTRAVRQRIVSPILMRFQQTGKVTPWANRFTWTPRLVEEKEKKRKYWVADIQASEPISDDDQDFYRELSASLRGAAERTMEEEPEPPADTGKQAEMAEA